MMSNEKCKAWLTYFMGLRPWVALYWKGISMRAASAKAASFLFSSIFADMILVKFTNCTSINLLSEQGMNIAAAQCQCIQEAGFDPRLCWDKSSQDDDEQEHIRSKEKSRIIDLSKDNRQRTPEITWKTQNRKKKPRSHSQLHYYREITGR